MIVRSSIRNPLWMLGKGKQMVPEFHKRDFFLDRNTIVDNVKVRFLKINNSVASHVLDKGIPDVPFFRHCPVKNLSSRRYLVHIQRDMSFEKPQAFTKTIPCNAPANGIELGNELIHLSTHISQIKRGLQISKMHCATVPYQEKSE